jgi:signal transduction histidine kinase
VNDSATHPPSAPDDLVRQAEVLSEAAWRDRASLPARALAQANECLELTGPSTDLDPAANERLRRARALALRAAAWASCRAEGLAPALKHAQRAREFHRLIGDPVGEADALLAAGAVHCQHTQYTKALPHLEEARSLFERVGDETGLARARNLLGATAFSLGDTAEALAHFERALAHARATGQENLQGICIGNIAKVHADLGRYDEAVELLEQGIAILRRVGDSANEAALLNSLGLTEQARRRPVDAETALRASIELRRKSGHRLGEAATLNQLAELLCEDGRYDESETALLRALDLARELDSDGETVAALVTRARLALARHPNGAATEPHSWLDLALALARQTDMPALEARVHRTLADWHEASGNAVAALRALREFLRLENARRDRSSEDRAAYLAARYSSENARREIAEERRRANELATLNAEISRQKDELQHLSRQLADKVVALEEEIRLRQHAELERQRLDRRMMETQKLESLGVLTGGIAHDFNNLLTGILGNAALAAEDTPPGSAIGACLAEIATAARRAADLCKQMLAYSGQTPIDRQPVDLAQLVHDTRALLDVAVNRRARLAFSLPEQLPPVLADSSQLQQVLVNLVTNAAEALPNHHGTVEIRAGTLHVDQHYLEQLIHGETLRPGLYVFLSVRDDGSGMDEATRRRALDPFFSTKFPGRGLGLSAALGIVRGHDGALHLESQPGAGTVVTVLLPVSPAASEPPAATPVDPAHPGRVLLVDDESVVRGVARKFLERLGFAVTEAGEGAEAIAAHESAPANFDLIITDFLMPELDGIETARALRNRGYTGPILLMSGYTQRHLLAEIPAELFAGFVAKPFSPQSLVATLSDCGFQMPRLSAT